jgi:hypothetical protein
MKYHLTLELDGEERAVAVDYEHRGNQLLITISTEKGRSSKRNRLQERAAFKPPASTTHKLAAVLSGLTAVITFLQALWRLLQGQK